MGYDDCFRRVFIYDVRAPLLYHFQVPVDPHDSEIWTVERVCEKPTTVVRNLNRGRISILRTSPAVPLQQRGV
jgi:hypothetical protein